MSTPTVNPAQLAPAHGSADFATCKIAFDLVAAGGLPLSNDDEIEEALFELKGDGWEASEYDGRSICGTFFVVEFDHIPLAGEVEAVRCKINAVLGSPQNVRISDGL